MVELLWIILKLCSRSGKASLLMPTVLFYFLIFFYPPFPSCYIIPSKRGISLVISVFLDHLSPPFHRSHNTNGSSSSLGSQASVWSISWNFNFRASHFDGGRKEVTLKKKEKFGQFKGFSFLSESQVRRLFIPTSAPSLK